MQTWVLKRVVKTADHYCKTLKNSHKVNYLFYINRIYISAQTDRGIVKEVGMPASTSIHTTKIHILPFPRRVQCAGEAGQERKNNTEIYKQCNFTIPTKIFCKVQDSMQETRQQRGRVKKETSSRRETDRSREREKKTEVRA